MKIFVINGTSIRIFELESEQEIPMGAWLGDICVCRKQEGTPGWTKGDGFSWKILTNA